MKSTRLGVLADAVDVGIHSMVPWAARLFNILWSDPIEDGAHADPNTFGLSAASRAFKGVAASRLLV